MSHQVRHSRSHFALDSRLIPSEETARFTTVATWSGLVTKHANFDRYDGYTTSCDPSLASFGSLMTISGW